MREDEDRDEIPEESLQVPQRAACAQKGMEYYDLECKMDYPQGGYGNSCS